MMVGKGEQGSQRSSQAHKEGRLELRRVGIVHGVGDPTPVEVGRHDKVPDPAVDEAVPVAQPDITAQGRHQTDDERSSHKEEELAARDLLLCLFADLKSVG